MLTLRNATVAVVALAVALAIVLTIAAGPASAADRIADLPTTVERWGVYEVRLTGPADGNPYADVKLSAAFRQGDRTVEPEGFYDGDGVYRIRFMPDEPGRWTYRTSSSHESLDGKTGTFTCVEPSPGNHGPVRVRGKFHFGYADGTPFRPIGTTLYGWVQEPDEKVAQTLAALRAAPFNKARMSSKPHAALRGLAGRQTEIQPRPLPESGGAHRRPARAGHRGRPHPVPQDGGPRLLIDVARGR